MKKLFIKNRLLLLIVICSILFFSSCYKKFDPKSYQPAFTVNGFESSAQIGAANLVGYWAFDGGYIDSVSHVVGTNTGTTFAAGFKGQALKGALNSYVVAPPSDGLKTLESFTVSEWVNTPPPSTGILDFFTLVNTTHFWGNIEMFFENGSDNTNGKLRVHVNKDGNDYTYAVDGVPNLFNSWVNIAVSYDAASSNFTLYVNGSKVNTGKAGTLEGPLNFADVGNVVFGCTQFQTDPSQTSGATRQDWASFITGQIDEVRVYNTALNTTELQALAILQGKGK
jgi:hypothetical protein